MTAPLFPKPLALCLVVLAITVACQPVPDLSPGPTSNTTPPRPTPTFGPKADDWTGTNAAAESGRGYSRQAGSAPMASPAMDASKMTIGAPAAGSIGLSAGGAKDIANFRENIKNGFLPLESDVTFEGLFYDYFFEAPASDCSELFCSTYRGAASKDPLSGETQYFVAVGLDSGVTDFARKSVNLVIVLDVSGSMDAPFADYYYDRSLPPPGPLPLPATRAGAESPETEESEADRSKTKMELAAESLVAIVEQLRPEDRLGVVLFSTGAEVAKPLNYVGETDLSALKAHILDLRAGGSTNMDAGIREGTGLFQELNVKEELEEGYENRILFLTDAMPNTGETAPGGLLDALENNAKAGIHTTFIGISVDFNSELVEAISKVRGANYYSVHSAKGFRERMDAGFDYLVSPLVYDLELSLDAPGFAIVDVFGTPDADAASGTLLKAQTLFASPKTDEGIKGGLILLQLKKTGDEPEMRLKVTYKDGAGKAFESAKVFSLKEEAPDWSDDDAVRKGVLLTRYASLLRAWITDERAHLERFPADEERHRDFEIEASVGETMSILPPEPWPIPRPTLGRWERQSLPLRVSSDYKRIFAEFADYFEEEMEEIGDEAFRQELAVLEDLAGPRVQESEPQSAE